MMLPTVALTVHQPWAQLIVDGRKTVELRRWDTPYRGRFWLHAGLKDLPSLDVQFGVSEPTRGAFVGSVELAGITVLDRARWESWRPRHLDPGPYQPGYFAWTLTNPRPLRQPVIARGRLNLFTVDPEYLVRLQAADAPNGNLGT